MPRAADYTREDWLLISPPLLMWSAGDFLAIGLEQEIDEAMAEGRLRCQTGDRYLDQLLCCLDERSVLYVPRLIEGFDAYAEAVVSYMQMPSDGNQAVAGK